MAIEKNKTQHLADAAKSSEFRDAAAQIAEVEIALSVAEQRDIAAAAENEVEQAEMVAELKAEKKQQATLRKARERINDSVPTRHLLSRPTFGPISATVQFHMRETFSFLLGRSSLSGEAHISGLFEAASNVRSVAQGHLAGCPYATWILVQIEEEITALRKLLKENELEARALINEATTLAIAPFTSKRPADVSLDFRVSYAFHFADLLTHYDRIMRMVKPYVLHSFVRYQTLSELEQKMGTPMRRLFRLPSTWSFVGKDAVAQQTATFLAAEHRMGILPDDILSGKKTPQMI